MATHGYLTALSICSEEVPEREWIDAIFSEAPHYKDDAQRAEIEGTLIQLKAHIARQLASDEEFELPCDLDLGDEPDDSDLRGWCVGFMECARPHLSWQAGHCWYYTGPMLNTETPASVHTDLDQYPTAELVTALVDDQLAAVDAVRAASPRIAAAVTAALPQPVRHGRCRDSLFVRTPLLRHRAPFLRRSAFWAFFYPRRIPPARGL